MNQPLPEPEYQPPSERFFVAGVIILGLVGLLLICIQVSHQPWT